ncbi:MAG: head-tail connector protein [Bacteroidales bacterium]|nr:head-tail connector protein [Bacteroidales bacterium]
MRVVTIDEIKKNSRIDGDMEDCALKEIGRVAENVVETAMRRSWGEVEAKYGEIPPQLRHACLMMADHLYTNRGASTYANTMVLPYGVAMMVKPYVKIG